MKTLRCLSCGYDRTGDVMPDGVTAVEPCETCGNVNVNVIVTDHKAPPKPKTPKTPAKRKAPAKTPAKRKAPAKAPAKRKTPKAPAPPEV